MNEHKVTVLRNFVAAKPHVWPFFFSTPGWMRARVKIILITFLEIKFPECVHSHIHTQTEWYADMFENATALWKK